MEVSQDGLERLQSAAADFARTEIARIAQAVIDRLRSDPAIGTFGEVAARHLWDEYCWALQEGPFDNDEGWDDVRLGSLSGAFDDLVRSAILKEVEKLPRHGQVFLSALACEEDSNCDKAKSLGSIWVDGMVNTIMEEVNERASQRDLDLIGPNREDAIGYQIEGSGMVWSVLSDRMDLIAGHADTMIDPDADLSKVAEEMVEAFMTAAKEEADDGAVFSAFLDRFEKQVRSLILENDVLPSLEDMRGGLLERLDA